MHYFLLMYCVQLVSSPSTFCSRCLLFVCDCPHTDFPTKLLYFKINFWANLVFANIFVKMHICFVCCTMECRWQIYIRLNYTCMSCNYPQKLTTNSVVILACYIHCTSNCFYFFLFYSFLFLRYFITVCGRCQQNVHLALCRTWKTAPIKYKCVRKTAAV